jgi:very-short-patch-repair endonuclease
MADVVGILQRSGGSATFAALQGLTSARSIRAALVDRQIRRVSKGVYALPERPASDLTVARANGGVLSHESAALHHGLQVVTTPLLPHVTIGRKRTRRQTELACMLHWADLPALGNATTPLRTVLDCARRLPFGEALAIADSAVRLGRVHPDSLMEAAEALSGPGRGAAIRACQMVDGRSESALESMLRARVIEAGFTGFIPQYKISGGGFSARVDLAHPFLRIVLEADSFAHHGTRGALRRDCRRYVNLAMRGWLLLRYSWEDVILDEQWVGESLGAVIAGRPARQNSLDAVA